MNDLDKNKPKPLVSIIMPTFNRAPYIEQTVLSILQQTFTNFELIILDDGSTDNTASVVNNINDNRIIYLKNKTNLGIQKTLNHGIKSAQGVFIARIDDQDLWNDIRKLERQVNFLQNNTDYVLVGTGVIFIQPNGVEIYRYLHPESDNDLRKCLLSKNHFTHSSVMFRKDSSISVGLYNETKQYRHVEDYDLWLRLGIKGKIHNLPDYSVSYVVDRNGLSGSNRVEQIKKNLFLIKKYKNDYPYYYWSLVRVYIRLVLYGYLNLFFISHITAYLARNKKLSK